MKKYGIMVLCALFFGIINTSDTLKIMSYNVRRQGNDPKEFQWDERKASFFELILEKNPAVIGFQEAVKGQQLEDIQETLSAYSCTDSLPLGRAAFAEGKYQKWVSSFESAKNETNPIFYDPARITFIRGGTFPINPVGKFFTASLPRIVTWAQFEDKNHKQQFYVYNTHLSSGGHSWLPWKALKDGTDLIRYRQMNMILDHITKNTSDLPVVIMGDLNTKIEGDIEKLLTKALFAHAKEKATITKGIVKGPNATRTGWNDNELKEIDHILVKGVDVEEYEIVKSPKGIYPSDHRPIMAKIILK